MQSAELKKFTETLETLTGQGLARYARRYICQLLYPHDDNAESEAQTALDLIHAEFFNRGIEKLYDMTYESVTKNPDVCKAA